MSNIILIRHVTPNVDNSPCDWQTAQQRIAEYDQTEDLCLDEIDLHRLSEITANISTVYCSPLSRAKRTAEPLFPTHSLQFDERLKEFNLRTVRLPFFRFSFKTWLTISRLLWFIGLLPDQRSFSQEKQRIMQFMATHALENSAIVAHGFVLRTIQKQLEQQGYRLQTTIKKGCFTVTVLTKPSI